MKTYPWFGMGMPMGGIGAGSVDFCPSGLFRQFLWMNNRPFGAGPNLPDLRDGAFFGIQAAGQSGFLFHPDDGLGWNEALLDPFSMAFVRYPEVRAEDRFPMAKLHFRFAGDFPVKADLCAWSPFIPHDVRNSAIPGIFFEFTVENLTGKKIPVTLFEVQRNLCSYTKSEKLTSVLMLKDRAMHLSRTGADPAAQDTGTVSIGILSDDPELKSSACANGFTIRDIWEPLKESGMLDCCDRGGKVQEIGNAGASYWRDPAKCISLNALAGSFTMKPHEKKKVTFVLTWHFPNQYELPYSWKKLPARRIGHYYNRFYHSAADVLADLTARYAELRRRTFAFRKELEQIKMEPWLLAAITAQLATFRKSAWLDEKGNFAVWEGLGYCGMQTVDVSFYGSIAVLDLFPELELSQMTLLGSHRDTDGTIGHSMPANFHGCNLNDLHRIDLTPDFAALFWRDVCATGNLPFFRKFYPVVCDALKNNAKTLDGAGLPYHKGRDQTYDQFPILGSASMTSVTYGAALAGMAELADARGDKTAAAKYRRELSGVLSAIEKRLWNGEYFSLSNDVKHHRRNEGVMADQLIGEWFRREAGGTPLLDERKVHSALKAVLRHCSEPEGYLRNCVWPKGERTRIGRWTANQIDWPWSGVEYAFAAMLERCGMTKEAETVAKNTFERYERVGMRFCHIECGPHYYRVMSVWAYYRALAGLSCNVLKGRLSLSFRHFSAPLLLLPNLRGSARLENGVLTLTLCEANFLLKELSAMLPDGRTKVWKNEQGMKLKKGKNQIRL